MNTRQTPQQRRTRRGPKRVSIALALAGASVLVAACGAGVATPGVANVGSTTSTTTKASSPQSGGTSRHDEELVYSQCMRSHGVPDFPDPSAGGGFQLSGGVNPSSASFASALATCDKLLPGGGPPGPGTTTNPSAAALAQMLKVAECMRRHGIAAFPDPTTRVPSRFPGGAGGAGGVVSDRDGVILVLPGSLNMQSPQFTHAAAECKFSLTNH